MYRFIHYLKTCQEIKSKQKEFGFVAKTDFNEGLKKRYNDTIKIQLNRKSWWVDYRSSFFDELISI
jgi:hypothetical protein